MRLAAEIERRKISKENFAERAGISYTWLRKILSGSDNAGPVARERIRAALATCTVCGHDMAVPGDAELFAATPRRRRKKRD